MKQRLLEVLACPGCRGKLSLIIDMEEMGEIREGKLVCRVCNQEYRISNYIPRFVGSDEYVSSFSFEWNKHQETQLDSVSGTCESEETFEKKAGFAVEDLNGKLVLDVGCGAGRFMEVVAKNGGRVVGIDLSFSTDAAFKNLGFNENVHIVQADAFCLPFKERTFDYIFSIGVLHHTPDTKKAFKCLPKFLKSGGEIAIWVYSNEGFFIRLYNTISAVYRFFTTKLPRKWLYQLVSVCSPLFEVERPRILRYALCMLVPHSTHGSREWRILDTFDWYAPKYQWKHTYSEVVAWFKESGLEDIKLLGVPVSVRGRRP